MMTVTFANEKKYFYPASKIEIVNDTMHGKIISDPYRWLEDENSSETIEWTAKQNEFTRSLLDKLNNRDEIREKLTKLLSLKSVGTPQPYGKKYFFTQREGNQNQSLIYVREGSFDASPRLLLDPNTLSTDGTVAIDWWSPSDDGSLLCYGTSAGGSEVSMLHILEVASGKILNDTIPYCRAASIAWQKDSKAFYYSKYPKPGSVAEGDEKYYRRIYYHTIGTNPNDDILVWGSERPKEEWLSCSMSNGGKWLMLSGSLDWSKNDLYVKDMSKENAELITIAENKEGTFGGDVVGRVLFLQTTYKAQRGRIVGVDLNDPEEQNWWEIIPEQKGVIQGFYLVKGKMIVNIQENATSKLFVYDLNGELLEEIQLPTLGTVSGIGSQISSAELFFSFTSFVYPPTIFRYDIATHEMKQIEKLDVDMDLSQYEVKQEWYSSKDNTKIPMFVINKKGLTKNGNNPTVLYGYGGFNVSMTPSFSAGLFSWLDKGGIYCVANLRGGDEFGEEWHQAGRRDKKQNVFDDFIAAAEWLIAQKYTSKDKLAIRGGSNGGLLTGATLTQRPDLFRAAIVAVPLLDMLRYQKFQIARLWIPEYGDPEKENEFQWLYGYSPYHKVKDGTKYPSVLLMTAESDTRVDPMHARKMAARLQQATSNDLPVIVRIESKAGHGAGKPVSKIIDAAVDEWSYLMWILGL